MIFHSNANAAHTKRALVVSPAYFATLAAAEQCQQCAAKTASPVSGTASRSNRRAASERAAFGTI